MGGGFSVYSVSSFLLWYKYLCGFAELGRGNKNKTQQQKQPTKQKNQQKKHKKFIGAGVMRAGVWLKFLSEYGSDMFLPCRTSLSCCNCS